MNVSERTYKFVLVPLILSIAIWLHSWKLLGFYLLGALIGEFFNKGAKP